MSGRRRSTRASSRGASSGTSPPPTPASGATGAASRSALSSPPRSEEEAVEDNNIIEDDQLHDQEESSGEELFGDQFAADYVARPELDTYGRAGVDDREYDAMDHDTRRAAEAAMRDRDREQANVTGQRRGRIPAALFDDDEEDDEADEEVQRRRKRRREAATRAAEGREAYGEEDDDDEATAVNLEKMKGQLRDFIVLDAPRMEVKKRFRLFLFQYVDKAAGGANVYFERINAMAAANRSALEISYIHLSAHQPLLAVWVADAPALILPIFDEVASETVFELYPNYSQIAPAINVRITGLPIRDSLRDIRQNHLNALIRVGGVVTRRSGVYPQLKMIKLDCPQCGYVVGPFSDAGPKRPSCPECTYKGHMAINSEQTVYRNYQKMTLQESPGTVPPGRLPRQKEVILLGDLIDAARPGEEIEVTGIYTNNFDQALNRRQAFPVFATVIEANYINKKQDSMAGFRLTEEDKRIINDLSQDPSIGDRIIRSIAPSIFGHRNIKTAIAMSMFGGQAKDVAGKHRIRGDINVLLLGDPGMAKSQFLKYVEHTSHRAVFTTGQGASAVGLTASVHKDPVTREWTLEGGALVLADQGVCLIDEFDKMNDADRTSIHEAMEQQSISIAKAGIVTTLQARCAVIAAANPLKGVYDPTLSFAGNVDLTEPILSRFDQMIVVRDMINPLEDERLANFVVSSHIRSHPRNAGQTEDDEAPESQLDEDIIPQDILKKYIIYAKQNCFPSLTRIDEDKLTKLYSDLRREATTGSGVPITVRQIESIIRMAEAYARMHLRDYVTDDDVDIAIKTALESFIDAQKHQVAHSLRKRFAQYINFHRDNDQLLLFLLGNMMKEGIKMASLRGIADAAEVVEIDAKQFEAKARQLDMDNIYDFYKGELFKRHGFRYVPGRNATIVKNLVSGV